MLGPSIHPGVAGTLHWWNHKVFGFFRALIWVTCVVRLLIGKPLEQWTLSIKLAAHWLVLGDLLLCLGFGLSIAACLQLQQAWRSGVDPSGPKQLVSSGLYRFSRNPSYIGVQLAQLGFFLAWPSIFSLVCLFVGVGSVHLQVAIEEKHLQLNLPSDFKRYQSLSPRWLSLK